MPVVYALGRRVFGQATGRLAALLAAVSPVLIYYSQETRMYGLVTLLAAASVYWAMPRLATGHERRHLAGLPAQPPWPRPIPTTMPFSSSWPRTWSSCPPWSAAAGGRRLRRWLAVQAAIVLAYLPWIAVQSRFLGGKASARFDEWNLSTALRIAGETVSALWRRAWLLPPAPSWLIAGLFLAAVAVGLAALSPLLGAPPERRRRELPRPSLPEGQSRG